jgi:DNA-binding response OmpR family regulator
MKESKSSRNQRPTKSAFQCEKDPPRRILVVEDDVDIRRLNAEVLMESGYKVDAAEDGAVAWAALQLFDYDLLITDNNMPTVTGVELIKKLRSEDMMLPVILMSGTMPIEELNLHPWLQIQATLLKPYSLAELLTTVMEVLRVPADVRAQTALPQNWQNLPPADIQKNPFLPVDEPVIASGRQINSPQRILVVDDERESRQLSVAVLGGSGYDVEAVKDGAAGWEALQARSYDLIITDNKMPRMTGLEMIGKLRSARMALPVIMATRNLPMHEFTSQPWLKPTAMLERPFSNADLLEVVKNTLHTHAGACSQTAPPQFQPLRAIC